MKSYKERIRELREDHEPRTSQQEIAKLLGISDRMYQRYEYGKSEMPARHLITLAIYYNTSADYILGLTNIQQPYPRTKKVTLK